MMLNNTKNRYHENHTDINGNSNGSSISSSKVRRFYNRTPMNVNKSKTLICDNNNDNYKNKVDDNDYYYSLASSNDEGMISIVTFSF